MKLAQRCGLGCLSLAITLSISISSYAQDASKKTDDKNSGNQASQAALDLTVPDSPAFAALDVTPNSVVQPGRGRDFAIGVLNGLDVNGNFQTGLALDMAPYWLFYGDKETLTDYNSEDSNEFVRGLKSTQFSLATAAGIEDADEAIRLATGLRWSFFDMGDPRRDKEFLGCIGRQFKKWNVGGESRTKIPPDLGKRVNEINQDIKLIDKRLDEIGEGTSEQERLEKTILIQAKKSLKEEKGSLVEQQEKSVEKAYIAPLKKDLVQNCRSDEDTRKRNWNRSSISLGAAPTFISDSGDTEDFEWSGAAVYGSIAYGFDGFQRVLASAKSESSIGGFFRDHAQIVAHVRYRADEVVPVEGMKGAFEEQDKLTAGGRFRLVYDQFNVNAEGAAIYLNRDDRDSDTFYRLQLGLDYKVPGAENLYLSLSIGGDLGRADGDQTFVFSALKWAFQSSPSISAN